MFAATVHGYVRRRSEVEEGIGGGGTEKGVAGKIEEDGSEVMG